jgi:hypothetical protein
MKRLVVERLGNTVQILTHIAGNHSYRDMRILKRLNTRCKGHPSTRIWMKHDSNIYPTGAINPVREVWE